MKKKNNPRPSETSKILSDEIRREMERKRIQDKWGNLGFLDGLKGHVKPEIAALYESYPSQLLTDGSISGKTDSNEEG